MKGIKIVYNLKRKNNILDIEEEYIPHTLLPHRLDIIIKNQVSFIVNNRTHEHIDGKLTITIYANEI